MDVACQTLGRTKEPTMHFRWSRLIWLIALSTGLCLLIFGLFIAQTLFSERESISWVLLQEHVYWASSQSNVESLRFRDALHRFEGLHELAQPGADAGETAAVIVVQDPPARGRFHSQ